jgi:FAD/FMN-containing dehydrogenase
LKWFENDHFFRSFGMLSRRELLRRSAQLGLAASAATLTNSLRADDDADPENPSPDERSDERGVLLNDEQSQLNPTRVRQVVKAQSLDDLRLALKTAHRQGRAISVAGGRHSMGGQQFGSDNIHLDMTSLNQAVKLDRKRGLVTVEAGMQWPELIAELHRQQLDSHSSSPEQPWTIRQKQTGVDAVTIAGSLASNMHGRGLKFPPFVHDIESFELLDASGKLCHCSRTENEELFSLAIGGYGLFGIVTHVTLRLVRRFKVRRRVEVISVRNVLDRFQARRDNGFVFGDCQYAIELSGDGHDHPGIMPCYEPVAAETPVSEHQTALSGDDWANLYQLVRTDKRRAFELYSQFYLKTDRQVYWSDTHQLAGAFSGHKTAVKPGQGTEIITEVYLSHENVLAFMTAVRNDLANREADISYGTIRFIEPDRETFLPWARERSVCIVCNLHVRHTDAGIKRAKATFRQILDRVVEYDGSFYLTYHRWAARRHMAACYPQMADFFRLKRKYDPDERFQSDWYRHYAPQFV